MSKVTDLLLGKGWVGHTYVQSLSHKTIGTDVQASNTNHGKGLQHD